MMPKRRIALAILLLAALALLTASCGDDSPSPSETVAPAESATDPESPTPPRSLPLRKIFFTVHVPDNTPPGEQVYLLLKPFLDWWWTEDTHIPLTDAGDGIWKGEASVSEGALIQYVFDRWDEQEWGEIFKETREGAGRGVPIESRLLLVTPDLEMVEDTVENWNDLRVDAPVGKLTGRVVDAETGEPVMDADVVAGGMHSATFHDGSFEFDAIAAGSQRITVWRVSGDYHPESVTVDVEAGSETDVPVALRPAKPVAVTFDVLLPEDTPPEAEIKLIGDVWQLGARQSRHPNFPYMPDGVSVPILERTAPGRASVTLELHEGTSISYFYTIASVFAGRERPLEGEWVFRSHVVGSEVETLGDQVASWRDPQHSRLTVRVLVPPNTPHEVKPLSGGFWMTRVGEREWITYRESWPGNTETFDVNLAGNTTEGAVMTGRNLVFGEDDADHRVVVDRWATLWESSVPDPGEAVTVPFRVSIPASTLEGAAVQVVFDTGAEFELAPQRTNRWMYTADVTLPGTGSYGYHVQRGTDEARGPDRSLDLDYAGQIVDDWVVAWSDEEQAPGNPDFIAGFYTNDYFSENFLELSPTTFDRVGSHNGSLVPLSSVWSYGQTQPVPFVEPRPVVSACVCLPLLNLAVQAGYARDAGLDVFIAPQFNMEMTPGGPDGLFREHDDAWWAEWLKAAERLWMWNAVAAASVDAELLMLPGYVFHVFAPPDAHESEDSFKAFDQALIDLMARVREVYAGKVLVSGGVLELEFPGLADLVGVTTFDTGRPDLPAGTTAEEWREAYDALFAERVDPIWERWGKPVFFYTINTQAISDNPLVTPEEAQATELEGIFQAMTSRPWIAGSMSWAYHMTDARVGDEDGVRNRLAEAVLAKYYGAYTGDR